MRRTTSPSSHRNARAVTSSISAALSVNTPPWPLMTNLGASAAIASSASAHSST
jgi:hypothetical protein